MATVLPVILGVMSVLFQVIGFVTPGWIRVSFGTDIIEYGLWYTCTNGSCIPDMSIEELPGGTTAINWAFSLVWLEFQVEATLGVIAGFCSLILACVFWKISLSESRNFMNMAVITSLISGILPWFPAGKCIQTYTTLSSLPLSAYVEFPYSPLLTGIGASLALLNTIFISIIICRANQRIKPRHVVQSDYKMQQVGHTHASGYPAETYTNQGLADNQSPD